MAIIFIMLIFCILEHIALLAAQMLFSCCLEYGYFGLYTISSSAMLNNLLLVGVLSDKLKYIYMFM